MQFTEERRGDALVIRLEETRLDHVIANDFRDQVLALLGEAPREVVLDLSAVQFMDSSGLGALVGIRKRVGWGVRIVLAGLKSPVYRVFELARMTEVFSFYTSAEVATGRGGMASYHLPGRR